MDDQMEGIQRYMDSFQNLDDAAALGLISAHIERDAPWVRGVRSGSASSRKYCR